MAVRIVTDSSAGLPADIVRDLDITVVNLHVLFDDPANPSTSGLSSLELAAAYARQLERGGDDGVVAVHLSKELSSTWSAAVAASAVFPDTVKVIETNTVGMALGAAAMAAARAALDGATLEECAHLAQDTIRRSHTWLYVHRLDEIRKSGRISAATALVSTALAAKPILQLHEGKIELAFKTRTQTKAFAKMVAEISTRAHGQPAFIAIQHNQAKEAARDLAAQLEVALHEHTTVLVLEMDTTLQVHAGPGALGVSAVFSA